MKTINILSSKTTFLKSLKKKATCYKVCNEIDLSQVEGHYIYVYECFRQYIDQKRNEQDTDILETKASFKSQVESLVKFATENINLSENDYLNLILHANDFPQSDFDILPLISEVQNHEYRVPDKIVNFIIADKKVNCRIYLFSHQVGSSIYKLLQNAKKEEKSIDSSELDEILRKIGIKDIGIKDKGLTIDEIQKKIEEYRKIDDKKINDEELQKIITTLKLCQKIIFASETKDEDDFKEIKKELQSVTFCQKKF